MLKIVLLLFISFIGTQGYPQSYPNRPMLFKYQFLYFPRKEESVEVFRYTPENEYTPVDEPQKRTQDYQYIHNGDYLKGVEDVLTGDPLGAGWIKNFDFGKFASVVIELGNDSNGHANGAFVWSSKLVFFKVINKRRLGYIHN